MAGQVGRPVVVGVNGSLPSYGAVEWGAYEARRRGAPLRLVHVVEPPDDGPAAPVEPPREWPAGTDEITATAAAYAHACVPGVEVASGCPSGDPVGRLVDESDRAAVVVVGSNGHVGLRGLLAGSVGTRAAPHAHCPLVVVRPHVAAAAGADPHHGVGRIVVGVDDCQLSRAALAFAFEEAALRGLGLTAVRAWRYPVPAGTGEMFFPLYQRVDPAGSERALLASALAPFRERFPEVAVCPVAVPAISPSAALIHESGGAELLVVGCHGRGGLATLLLGSVSQAALHRACCPVAVVHG